MSKYTKIKNPRTGSTVFATMPDIGTKDTPTFMPSGEIYLYEGEYWYKRGVATGFGLAHIEHKHGPELVPHGYTTTTDYIRFVDEVLRPGAVVHTEVDKTKPIVVQASIGMVVLQSRYDFATQTEYYYVVTAYKKARPHGWAIGDWK